MVLLVTFSAHRPGIGRGSRGLLRSPVPLSLRVAKPCLPYSGLCSDALSRSTSRGRLHHPSALTHVCRLCVCRGEFLTFDVFFFYDVPCLLLLLITANLTINYRFIFFFYILWAQLGLSPDWLIDELVSINS